MQTLRETRPLHWVRADRYVIEKRHIRPAPDATFTTYRYCERNTPGMYLDLFSVVAGAQQVQEHIEMPDGDMRAYTTGRWSASTEVLEGVARWCSHHGLLGLLPHQASTITMPATLGIVEVVGGRQTATAPDEVGEAEVAVRATQMHFVRTPHGWISDEWVDPADAKVRNQDYPWQSERPPGAVIQPLQYDRAERVDSDWLHRYFPAVPLKDARAHRYPKPSSPAFWRDYGEPLQEFLMAAALLRGTIRDLLTAQATRTRNLSHVMRPLEKLMAGLTITLALDSKGDLQAPLVPNSLLGWLARGALKDVCERRLHACSAEDCGKLFVSTKRRARFCSDRCKSRIHKRETRRRRPRS